MSAWTDHLTALRLLNDASVVNANGLNGILSLSLNPSAATFEPIIGNQICNAANSGQADLVHPPGTEPMSAQQYEALLDLNYMAD